MDASWIRKTAWNSLKGNYWTAVLAAFLAALFGALLVSGEFHLDFDLSEYSEIFQNFNSNSIASVLLAALIGSTTLVAGAGINIVPLVLGGVVQLGYCTYLLKQLACQQGNVRDLFSKFDYFKQGFLQKLLRAIFTALWSLLFVIPGIIKSLSYSMTPFIMAENPDMTAKDAIRASMALMDGHKWDLFWLNLTFIGWDLLCLLTFGIGVFFLNPYKNAAYTVFYKTITADKWRVDATVEA